MNFRNRKAKRRELFKAIVLTWGAVWLLMWMMVTFG